jgi:2,7-dihydroxy-5-methyl-1-naphthoate 7-O-methyltransferase
MSRRDARSTAGQSFFDPLPAGADIYLLKGILNDWPDAEAKTILSRCAESARPNGRVVVLGGVSPEEASRGLYIEMVLLGGRHRTVTEFRELAREAGLEVLAVDRQPSGHFITELRPITTTEKS